MEKIDSIGALNASALIRRGATATDVSGAGNGGGFAKALSQALDAVNGAQSEASGLAREFQLGSSAVSLEETMIAMQKANISFQTAVQVRNRVVSAYHDIMNMPV
jgi:flagellar hook-basal body complex protein FliE